MLNISRILYPTDFSEYSMAALPYAIDLSKQNKAELHCLHVVNTAYDGFMIDSYKVPSASLPVIPQSEILKLAQEKLDRFVADNVAVVEPLVTKVIIGEPFVEIIRYARGYAIDLIVMGTHGHNALAAMLLGTVAEKVVRKAPYPVLTVRHPKHKFEAP
jgi:nucleotide-binding universal stress UspA family protein